MGSFIKIDFGKRSPGYIKKVVAILDGKKLDRGLIAFSHVLLTDHTKETLDQFENAVTRFPEVMEFSDDRHR